MRVCERCGVEEDTELCGTYFQVNTKKPKRSISIGKYVSVALDKNYEPTGILFPCATRDITVAMVLEVSEFRLTEQYAPYITQAVTSSTYFASLCTECAETAMSGDDE